MKSIKNISRQAYRTNKNTWSWMLRICADRPEGVQEYFYDRDYGGAIKSRAAAKKRLAELKRTLPAHLFRGTKGVVLEDGGVTCRWFSTYYKDTMYRYLAAQATWCGADGKRRTKTFACSKYGTEKAKVMARAYREKMIAELGYVTVKRPNH